VNILLKQRLIGAIVLISLAVIFIPMFFTSQGDGDEQKFESSIPPEPSYEIKSPQVSVPLPLPPPTSLEKVPLSDPQIKGVSQDSTDTGDENPHQATAASTKPPVGETPKPSLESGRPAKVVSGAKTVVKTEAAKPVPAIETTKGGNQETAPAVSAQTVKATTAPAKVPKPAKVGPATPAEKTGAVTGWVVQVGSFGKKDNAVKLRDRLRKMGMACFVASGQSNGMKVYRVRVGPEIGRADAEKIQAVVKAKTKLNGLVMQYP
jgi:DedD protein